MSFSGLLDVAISLIFFYLVLSLICTTINELIATIFKMRARWLTSTIPVLIDNSGLLERFQRHGLIANDTNAAKGKNVTESGKTASYVDSRTFAMALLGSLDPSKPAPIIADIQGAVAALPPGRIRDVLAAQLAAAGTDIEKLRTNLAEWFDAAMDRLSGSYKRWLKWISLATGVALAVALNVDSWEVGIAVWRDQTLRAEIVSDAADLVKAGLPASSCTDPDPDKKAKCLSNELRLQGEKLRAFPIGWTKDRWEALSDDNWFPKLLGCLLTGLALSLGAPFWFDVLAKFMNVRGAGVKPTKEEEKKK